MSAGALALSEVTRRFGADVPPAVDGVSFEVNPGELLALVGASGSGKTTTLRIAAGYEYPDAGKVTLDGRDITQLTPQRRGFGMVFQHYALFPHMSVQDNVAFGLEARGVPRARRLERARQALSGVGLAGAGQRPVQSLSGGEQQRVALARALVIEPRVLLLDEPLSNLDPALRQSTREELRSMLRRLNVTALFVTHDQEDAFAIADRVALLRHGKLLQVGTPEEIYDTPISRDVAEFIGRATLVPALDEDDGEHASITIAGCTARIAVRRPPGYTRIPDALAVLRPESLALAAPDDGRGALGGWPGEIVDRRFAGGHTIYQVRLADDLTVEVASSVREARSGDRAFVRIAEEVVALVPR